jgi:hypothetical protein
VGWGMEEEEAGVRERRGVLKVVVASGTNLAVRDFTSSDPYVVVRLAAMVSHPPFLDRLNSLLNHLTRRLIFA